MGYPGTVNAEVCYRLSDDSLIIDYTAETDADGEIDFPGYEVLSAFIGGYFLLNNCYVEGDALKKHIMVILGHLYPFCQSWKKYPSRKDKFLEEITPYFDCPVYAEETLRLIEILDSCDEGCSNYEMIQKYQGKFKEGERIIRHMTEFSDF